MDNNNAMEESVRTLCVVDTAYLFKVPPRGPTGYSAKSLKIQATIFMPKTTPSIKVDSVRKLKAKVILTGDNFDAALIEAQKFCKKKELPF